MDYSENAMDTNIKGKNITPQWLDGIGYEVAFWNNVYRWPHTFRGMMGWSNYGSAIDLEGFDANAFLVSFDHPQVYDVGSGMSYAVGTSLSKADGTAEPLRIHYMDPLAFHFNRILDKYGKDLPRIEFGMVEYLSAFIPDADATLITVQNALDHSANPIKGIVEALLSLRNGGVLYLNHHPNEAETEKYKGFHQYNIDEKDGELVIWNKNEHVNVSRLLADAATVETKRIDNGHIIAVITKTFSGRHLPESLSRFSDEQRDRSELCRILLLYQQSRMSLARNLKDRLNYCLFNTVQCFAQMLPWSLKMKVKRLIRQA